MSKPIDTEYYKQRARQERTLAETSNDTVARRVHAELAERYTQMLAPAVA